jgi:DNA-binding NarL/FixJ family response regulator
MQLKLQYDDVLDVMEVGFHDQRVKTDRDVDAVFTAIDDFWGERIRRKILCLVDYASMRLAPAAVPAFSARVQRAVMSYTSSTFRYSDSSRMQDLADSVALHAGVPRNVYRGREQAFMAIRPELLARRAPERLWTGKLGLLSPRERTVATFAAQGFQNAQIAANLGTSAHTVRHQLESIYDKCTVSTRAELAWLLSNELRQRETELLDALQLSIARA